MVIEYKSEFSFYDDQDKDNWDDQFTLSTDISGGITNCTNVSADGGVTATMGGGSYTYGNTCFTTMESNNVVRDYFISHIYLTKLNETLSTIQVYIADILVGTLTLSTNGGYLEAKGNGFLSITKNNITGKWVVAFAATIADSDSRKDFSTFSDSITAIPGKLKIVCTTTNRSSSYSTKSIVLFNYMRFK